MDNELAVPVTIEAPAGTPGVLGIVFDTLPDLGMDRMTDGGVEFVLCASALTAQV
jgi:hypothetical protein